MNNPERQALFGKRHREKTKKKTQHKNIKGRINWSSPKSRE
jgi:hypothetical protein